MARITVEDCIKKVKSAFELVLIAKERAVQLNSGDEPKVDRDNDKNTVISLREIAEDKVSVKGLEESAVTKLRKVVEESQETEEEEVEGDDFESLYKGEISKSGVPILPSKRARKIPEKKDLFKSPDNNLEDDESKTEEEEISLDEVKEEEESIEKKTESLDSDQIPDNN
jgi:DNA-directed RNA polymerase subunit omega